MSRAEVKRFANTVDAFGRRGQLTAQILDSISANLQDFVDCVGSQGQEGERALSTAQLNKWDVVLSKFM